MERVVQDIAVENTMDGEEKQMIYDFSEDVLSEKEARELAQIQKDFLKSYAESKDKLTVEEWLPQELQKQLPERTNEEIQEMSNEIVGSLKVAEEKKESLQKAVESGRSKESWLASELTKYTSLMSAQEGAEYLRTLDRAVADANEAMASVITTKAGNISKNNSLDGFIAEEYHAQTLNMNLTAKGHDDMYKARTLKADGRKNTVDVVVDKILPASDSTQIVRKYQSKYYQNAQSTEKAFQKGDYRGQRRLAPEGQEVNNASSVIEAPDGTTSNSLSKENAKKMQDEVQSGEWKGLDWNEYHAKDLAVGIGKQVGYSCLQGAAVGAGINIAEKIWNGEEIDGEEVVETAITTGADFGVKTATAGALKVAAEKEVIKVLPKGKNGTNILTNVAYVAVENVKVMGKVATGELTVREGVDKMQQTTASCVAGIAATETGKGIGATIGTVLGGPIGGVIGGFVGGTVGYIAGSKVGETVVKGAQKVRDTIKEKVGSFVESAVDTVKSTVSGFFSGFASLFGF